MKFLEIIKKNIGLILLGIIFVAAASTRINLNELNWVNVRQVEKKSAVRISNQLMLSGSTVILYSGQPANLTGIHMRYIGTGTPYDVTGSTDSVKVYSTLAGVDVAIGYISDSTFISTSNITSYTSLIGGKLDGTIYKLIIPASKFTGEGGYYDVVSDITTW